MAILSSVILPVAKYLYSQIEKSFRQIIVTLTNQRLIISRRSGSLPGMGSISKDHSSTLVTPQFHLLRMTILVSAVMAVQLISASPLWAANWLMLQGTESAKTNTRVIMFAQPSLTKDYSDQITLGPNAGKTTGTGTIAPWFNNQQRLHFRRAKLGLRGNLGNPGGGRFVDGINYFVMAAFAPNLFNYNAFGERARLMSPDHASLTFNHIPGARVRTGLFKMPGPEESYQPVLTMNYIEFSGFVATQILERFATGNMRASPSGGINGSTGTAVTESYGFNGVRDWAVQVFDSHRIDSWDLSYALALGRGEAIHIASPDYSQLEQYLYLSAEYDLPGGKGPLKHGVKGYAWHQTGERRFESDLDQNRYQRTRYGVGMRALGKLFGSRYKHRLGFEAMFAEGMIFVGPAGGVKGGALQYAAEQGNKAYGLTLDYGFYLDENWLFDMRFARMDLLYETDGTVWTQGDQRQLTEKTLDLTYHFTFKNRITFNYIFREKEAPHEDHAVVQNVVGTIGNRWTLQWTWFY